MFNTLIGYLPTGCDECQILGEILTAEGLLQLTPYGCCENITVSVNSVSGALVLDGLGAHEAYIGYDLDVSVSLFMSEHGGELGQCDTCGGAYELSSRDGRCGDCGECSAHCLHGVSV